MFPAIAMVDKAPINLTIQNSQIVCENGFTKYDVSFEDIETVDIIDELPENMFRAFGYGGENLIKGDFSSSKINNMKVIADPHTPPYILINTTDGKVYLFGSRNSNNVNEIYKNLTIQLLN